MKGIVISETDVFTFTKQNIFSVLKEKTLFGFLSNLISLEIYIEVPKVQSASQIAVGVNQLKCK